MQAGAAEPQRLTHDGLFKQRPAWSPDGKQLVFARHQGVTIFLYQMAIGGAATRLTDRKDPEYDAVWSPDGKRLAFSFVKVSPNQGDVEVYTVAVDGTDLKPVAVTGPQLSHEESPTWSPDGKSIAYSTTRDGNQEIYVARARGWRRAAATDEQTIWRSMPIRPGRRWASIWHLPRIVGAIGNWRCWKWKQGMSRG